LKVTAPRLAAPDVLQRNPRSGAEQVFTRVGDSHRHPVGLRCGAIQEVDCMVRQAPCAAPSNSSGFTMFAAEVSFNRLCPRCQNSGTNEPTE
jgi:Fur family ferric uptake transcriptional regulator